MTAPASVGAEPGASMDQHVRRLIYQSCLLLDANDFAGWLELCAPDFHYTISAYSPEIRKDQTWLDHNLEEMRNLISLLPKHNSDQNPLTRHATVYTIDHDQASNHARAVTSVAIFSTALDGGESTLFALARYHDIVDREGPRLKRRVVRLETRSLGIGKHWPL
jgi:methanesulfonate monooxygenase small subunit